MPKIDLLRDLLFHELGRTYTQEEFEHLCFEYGIELDDVTSKKHMEEKEKGTSAVTPGTSEEVIYKIDVPANRIDLLCLEGISRALLIFAEKIKPPKYVLHTPSTVQRIIAHPETLKVRPIVIGAVLRNISFNPVNYESFIELQEKLHQLIGRKRTLVSIGTHDLDTIQGPFTYEALSPKDIKFVPLDHSEVLDAEQLFAHIEANKPHLEPYLHIIRNSPVYPVIYDRNRTVLSLPPIINGDHSKIKLSTKNVLIEITATDKTKAIAVLNVIIAMFSQHCSPQYYVESVEVQEADGVVNKYPDLSERTQAASVAYIKNAIGVSIETDQIVGLLNRMSLPAVLHGEDVSVTVPITRSDIMHACDIMEDVAIAYGYNNIQKQQRVPQTVTTGIPQPLNKVTDLLRVELSNIGYTEILAFSLCSVDENFKKLRRPNDNSAVILDSNSEFQCGRVTLLGGMLQSVSANKAIQLPIRIFEVGDVFSKNSTTDTGASNRRLIAGIYCATTSSFETIHGVVDRIMLVLRIPKVSAANKLGYEIKPSDDPAFFEQRRVDIYVANKKVGVLGVIHPEVNRHYDIPHPCTAFEFEVSVELARLYSLD